MQQFTLIFLAFVAARMAFQLWLSSRQIAHVHAHRNAVPPSFSASVTAEQHARAADYTAARQRLSMIETIVEALAVAGLTIGGGIAGISEFVSGLGLGPVLTQTVLVLAVVATLALIDVPFGLYRTFSIEQRFGFNRSTLALHLADLAKGLLIALLLGGVIVALVLALMIRFGDRWWIAGWLAWTSFTLLLTWAWPRVIAPMFNRFAPLEDVALRSRIDALLARCGFRSNGLFVMDGSRRSAHGNAYFTGLGRNKRIVFFDTLLSTLAPDEVESVLGEVVVEDEVRHDEGVDRRDEDRAGRDVLGHLDEGVVMSDGGVDCGLERRVEHLGDDDQADHAEDRDELEPGHADDERQDERAEPRGHVDAHVPLGAEHVDDPRERPGERPAERPLARQGAVGPPGQAGEESPRLLVTHASRSTSSS